MSQTLFIRRYPDRLAVSAVWLSRSGHWGCRSVGELKLVATRGSERIDSEQHSLAEDCLAEREQRTTQLTNDFAARAREQLRSRTGAGAGRTA